MATQEKMGEELQRLAENNADLAIVIDELGKEETALQDRAFLLFRISVSLEVAQAPIS